MSFQPYPRDSDAILLHHTMPLPSQKSKIHENGHVNGTNGYSNPRPIEFRRRVILKATASVIISEADKHSPMTKLLQEEQKRAQPRMVPVVEVHPLKILYNIVSDDSHQEQQTHGHCGFVLVSQRTSVYDALQGLMKIAAPSTSTSCKRIWSKRNKCGTNSGDGFEVVHLDTLNGQLIKPGAKVPISRMLVYEWVRQHGYAEMTQEFEVLVETKSAKGSWPRAELELENRIKVSGCVNNNKL